MFALLSLPYVLPYAFVYDIMFAIILAVILALSAKYPSFRKYATALLLIGLVELAFSWGNGFTEGIIIGFATLIGGIMIPILDAIKPQLGKNSVKISLTLLGCVALLLGAISLYYSETTIWFYQSTIMISHAKGELLIVGIVLPIVGFYSLIVGIASFIFINPKKP